VRHESDVTDSSDLSFTCACCGKTVSGLPDLAYDAPLHYDRLPEAERAERARLDADFCIIDGEDHFIRVVCPVPIRGTEAYFGWGVWVSLSVENFARYRGSFMEPDQSSLGGMFGWLCNRLPIYPDTLELQTSVLPQDGGQRPLVWINENHVDHPLYVDQREGITADRLGEIYASEVCENRDESSLRSREDP
jgi:hypothetical protein